MTQKICDNLFNLEKYVIPFDPVIYFSETEIVCWLLFSTRFFCGIKNVQLWVFQLVSKIIFFELQKLPFSAQVNILRNRKRISSFKEFAMPLSLQYFDKMAVTFCWIPGLNLFLIGVFSENTCIRFFSNFSLKSQITNQRFLAVS